LIGVCACLAALQGGQVRISVIVDARFSLIVDD